MSKYLTSKQELAELRRLTNHEGWPILIRLLEALELEALRALASFSNGDQAFERRGEVVGVQRVLKEIKKLRVEIPISPYLRDVEEEKNERPTENRRPEY
jgi:hypothetical protein